MTEPTDKQSAEPADNKKTKALDLDELTPPKVPVETSVGTLYVGSHGYPVKVFKAELDEKVGEAVMRSVCNRDIDKNNTSPLDEKDMESLVADDVAKLGPVIAKQQRWPDEEQPADLAALGQSAKRSLERSTAQVRAQMEKLNDSLKSSFSFLTQSTLSKLQTDMGALSQMNKLGDALKTSGVGRVMEELRKQQALLKPADSILERVKASRSATDALQEAIGETAEQRAELRLPDIPVYQPEQSPLARAALQSAENSERSVELMGQMTQCIASVQETLVNEVLPQWFKDTQLRQDEAIASGKKAAQEARHASITLTWTIVGIVVSILITAGATAWQVLVAKEIDEGNSKQMDKLEAALKEQKSVLSKQKELQDQALEQQRLQLVELQALRQRLEAQKPTTAQAKDSKRDAQ
jgi:hypothetical protein